MINSPNLIPLELFPSVSCWSAGGVVPCGTEVCWVTSHGWPVAWINSPNLIPVELVPSVNGLAPGGVIPCGTEVCWVTSHGWPKSSMVNSFEPEIEVWLGELLGFKVMKLFICVPLGTFEERHLLCLL